MSCPVGASSSTASPEPERLYDDQPRAYRGLLGAVLGRLLDTRPAVWVGFSFTDRRIETILREIGDRSSTSVTTRPASRHVAIMSWDPAAGRDPGTIRSVMAIQLGCRVVLYPAPDGDHRAFGVLLAELTDPRYPAAALAAVQATPDHDGGRCAARGY